ncbi:MAG: helix-hairpin-helix domain-containing protein [Rikenellaceae bacterium]|nr:helix-hairpin-helix domain-containing protein [Rikenellaceae bacterium]
MKKFAYFLENLISALSSFSRPERSGIVLIAVLAAGVFCRQVYRAEKPLDHEYLAQMERINDSLRQAYFLRVYSRPTDRSADTLYGERSGQTGAASGEVPVYIELNRADSAALCTVRGIGPVLSGRIMRYRERLGGFVRKSQLWEVRGITEENFTAISAQFFLDTAGIQKINLNFAPANSLRAHPYFTASMIDRITGARQTKGGWKTLRELVEKDILLPDEAERVAPYVVFTAP